ncbi:vWA domain-containing protein [Nocardioides solisilvae]|uniref:vWA domain-containing protein n=1 Tax=Nocardioides solisilvae TaxID=1542435 RepID=UPI000D745F65|nr:VWA domain-containing protein [Nocardioides solisilvae]
MSTVPVHAPADEALLGLARAAGDAGVPVTPDRARGFLEAVATLGLGDRAATRQAGRATLCSGPEDLARFDAVLDAWFGAWHDGDGPRAAPSAPPPPTERRAELAPDAADEGGDAEERLRATASGTEVLRHRDVADLDDEERRRLAGLFEGLRPVAPLRRSARHQPWRRGTVDLPRTLRASLRLGGEPARLELRRRARRPRRVVLLVDVSGSMGPYADALLRLAHRFVTASSGPVEVFTVGTRVTRITRALALRDPDRALAAAGDVVPDWAGGTRLGESLRFLLDRWGQAGLVRGAVVVVLSDGWERGDPDLLGEQAARLGRLAHRTVWVNPHRGKPGYEPVQGGVRAVLPHVDDFLAGHSLATFADLVEVVRRA